MANARAFDGAAATLFQSAWLRCAGHLPRLPCWRERHKQVNAISVPLTKVKWESPFISTGVELNASKSDLECFFLWFGNAEIPSISGTEMLPSSLGSAFFLVRNCFCSRLGNAYIPARKCLGSGNKMYIFWFSNVPVLIWK